MLRLRVATSERWVQVALSDFDAFLVDHAACERKASASALSLVAHYRDREELVSSMIELAREELEHFQQVYLLLKARGVPLGADKKDEYVNQLTAVLRKGSIEFYLLDRLLALGIVEARGTERFGMLAEALPEGDIGTLYREFTRAEARHYGLFLRLARRYYDEEVVSTRLDELLEHEGHVIERLPLTPAVH